MPIRPYVRSTDFNRKPCGKNIIGGINIAVVVGLYPLFAYDKTGAIDNQLRSIPFKYLSKLTTNWPLARN
jgi:hypothetical protein